MSTWRSFTERLAGTGSDEALVTGVPAHLRPSIQRWLHTNLITASGATTPRFSADVARELERRLRGRVAFPSIIDSYDASTAFAAFYGSIMHDDDVFLDAIDFVLSRLTRGFDWRAASLDKMLTEGGSAYCVGVRPGGHFELQRRLTAEVQQAAEDEMSENDRPAEHLRAAWSAIYGLNPNPSHGYGEAVRAVESAAKPVVSPNDPKATLGTIIPALVDGLPKGKWKCTLRFNDGTDGTSAVVEMLRLLWQAQHDRHGTDDESAPLAVSQSEAEAAIHLAVTVVHWFRTGVLTRA
jgi:hypothetical protein